MFGRILTIITVFVQWFDSKIRGNAKLVKSLQEERRQLHETLERKNKYIKELEKKIVSEAGPAELAVVYNRLFSGASEPSGGTDTNGN